MCECNHLTDFAVFEMPTSWDDVLASLAEGFSINPLTWEDFVNCMKNANWDRYWFVCAPKRQHSKGTQQQTRRLVSDSLWLSSWACIALHRCCLHHHDIEQSTYANPGDAARRG